MRKYLSAIIILSVLVVLAGCKPSREKEAVTEKPRIVRVEKITSQDLPIYVRAVGRLVPNREVVVSSQVTGILKQYNADVGAAVAAGDALAQIDITDYELALNEAKANLLSARARLDASQNSYKRARNLLPGKAITPELYDKYESEYKSAQARVTQTKAAVDIARRRLDKTVIKAPFDGYVTQRMVEVGQNMAIGDPAMAMADLETMRVRVHLNERDYVHLDKDDLVDVKIEAFSNLSFSGRVDKIGIKSDPRTNTFEVEILLENPGIILKAGLTARVSIRTKVIHDAIMIAQNCVLFRESGKEVFVIEEDNRAAARKVQLGRVNGSSVQILEGIASGDVLVVTGGQYLKPGDKVEIVP